MRDSYGDDWSSLRVPGQNGLLGVVAVLSWWMMYAVSEGVGQDLCVEAVSDAKWAMEGLLQHVRARATKTD